MPETLTFDPDTGLMRIHAWGKEAVDDWIASRQEILRLHAEHGASRLFVEARDLEGAPSVLDIFDFGDSWPDEIRAAIVVGRNTPEDVMFLDSVAVHRHKPMRVFYDEDEAMRWLYDSD